MSIRSYGGAITSKAGHIGSGIGCCCCTPNACPNGDECAPPCVCVDGQCVPKACCQCDNWQIKVNGVPVATAGASNPFNATTPPEIFNNPWMYHQHPPTRFGTVTVDLPQIYNDPFPDGYDIADEWIGTASGRIECIDNELVVALFVNIGFANYSMSVTYHVYYKISQPVVCSGSLAATKIDPPENAIRTDIDGSQGLTWTVGQETSSGAVFRGEFGDIAIPDINFFDASQLSVALECDPPGVCCDTETGACVGWDVIGLALSGVGYQPPWSSYGLDYICGGDDMGRGPLHGNQYLPDARCADDPCNPLP